MNGSLKNTMLNHWAKLTDEFVQRFGFNESTLDIMRKEADIARMVAREMITGDRSKRTLIEVKRLALEELKGNTGKQVDLFELKASMEAALKITIDPMRCSVTEFQSFIKLLKKK